jgi:hypothetical protein
MLGRVSRTLERGGPCPRGRSALERGGPRPRGRSASSLWWAAGATRVVIVARVCVLALWISLHFAFFTK